jgi:hypothetical protein
LSASFPGSLLAAAARQDGEALRERNSPRPVGRRGRV